MKPFQLEAVLKYRKRLKDIAQNKFEEAKKQHSTTKEKLTITRNESLHLIEKLTSIQKRGVSIEEHILFERRIEYLDTRIKVLEKELFKKQEIVVRERTFLLQKSKEQRVMEKLKEKQNIEWQHFLDKKEAAMLDEIAVLHHTN